MLGSGCPPFRHRSAPASSLGPRSSSACPSRCQDHQDHGDGADPDAGCRPSGGAVPSRAWLQSKAVFKSELNQAIRTYHAQWNAGRQALHQVASDAYWRRVNVERAMVELKIPKEPKGVQERGEVPEPPPGSGA